MNAEHEEYYRREGMSIKAWLMLLGSIIVLGIVGTVLALALPTIRALAPFLGVVIVTSIAVAIPLTIAGALYYLHTLAQGKRIQSRIVRPNANNAYGAMWVEEERCFVQPVNGQLPTVVPQTYSPQIHNHNDVAQLVKLLELTQASRSAPALLPEEAGHPLPKIELFYDLIHYNSLYTAMGIEAATGKPVLAPIVKSTHFKLIGGSGQGKSCVAASMLDIAITTNDPDHLRIGLLDLEHNTSRLFEDAPHVAEIGPKRQRLVGRDPDEVAQKLKLLQWELSRRAGLGEDHCRTHEPVLLVYVEEMLSLKYEVVDRKLKTEMLAAINIIGIRGRKYGIFLLACMQTDYSDKSTREAMAQFRTRGGFAIDPDTARASGFFNTELINQNFQAGQPGQYVLEKPQYSGLVLSPEYDVKVKLEMLGGAATPPATGASPIRLRTLPRAVETTLTEVATEGELEAVPDLPLRRPSQADGSTFSAQEQRIIDKFYQQGLGIGQIVSSEYTNGKGEPLAGGEAYKQRSKEVQEIIRRFHSSREVS